MADHRIQSFRDPDAWKMAMELTVLALEIAPRLRLLSDADLNPSEAHLARTGQVLHGPLRSRRLKPRKQRGAHLALLGALGLSLSRLAALGWVLTVFSCNGFLSSRLIVSELRDSTSQTSDPATPRTREYERYTVTLSHGFSPQAES